MKKLKEKIENKLGEKKTAKLKKTLHVARIVKNVVCWTLIAILTIAVVFFMATKISGGSPKVFGYSLNRIITGSMEPELMIGDVILSKEVKDPSEIGIGSIITFQGDARFDNQKVTHRVQVAPYDDGKGNLVLVTKGDANEKDDGVINYSDVESIYLSKINPLRDIYNFFFSTWGFLVFIFLLLLIFFDEIVNIIRLTIGGTKEEDTESFQEIVERVKREQLEEAKKKREAERKAKEKEEQEKQDASDAADTPGADDPESDLLLIEEIQPEEADTVEPLSVDTDDEQDSAQADVDTVDVTLSEEVQPEEADAEQEPVQDDTDTDSPLLDDVQPEEADAEKEPKSYNSDIDFSLFEEKEPEAEQQEQEAPKKSTSKQQKKHRNPRSDSGTKSHKGKNRHASNDKSNTKSNRRKKH